MRDITRLTDEEDAAINKAIAEDPDTWEWSEEDFRNAVRGNPFTPENRKKLGIKGRPPFLPEQRKVKTTIMFDRAVLEHFKKDGKGWQTRINDTLRDVAGLG